MKLFAATIGLLWTMKLAAVLKTGHRPAWIYWTLWPGIDPKPFTKQAGVVVDNDPAIFLRGWMRMLTGLAAMLTLAWYADRIPEPALGWLGLAAMLLTLHLGFSDVLPWLLRWAGWPAAPALFIDPWKSRTPGEFWSRRWNLAFVEMNHLLFLAPARRLLGRRYAGTSIFLLSGILHEFALSFPAGAGWGGPLAYFALQAVAVRLKWRGRILTALTILAPLPLLFHAPARAAIVLPLYRLLHEQIHLTLDVALLAAGCGHFLVLVASVQVPGRLGWRTDIPKLTRFNQKIFWLYSVYIVFCIVGFGLATLAFRADLLAQTPLARGTAAFIAVFWTLRFLADLFWYDHRDWPPGNVFVLGHALLTTLFVSLASVYWLVAVVV